MALEQTPLRPMLIDYKCDICDEGYYRPFGGMLLTDPPKFDHKCTVCNDKKVFTEKYPTIRHSPEGEMLDLDNYIQQTF